MVAGNARNSKLLDLCVIEIGAIVILKIEVLVCEVEFHSHRGLLASKLNILQTNKINESKAPIIDKNLFLSMA